MAKTSAKDTNSAKFEMTVPVVDAERDIIALAATEHIIEQLDLLPSQAYRIGMWLCAKYEGEE